MVALQMEQPRTVDHAADTPFQSERGMVAEVESKMGEVKIPEQA